MNASQTNRHPLTARIPRAALCAGVVAGAAGLLAAAPPGQDGEPSLRRAAHMLAQIEIDDVPLAVQDLAGALDAHRNGMAAAGGIDFLSEAELFFEENATDGDLGIHFFADGDPWERLLIFAPNFQRLADMRVRGNAGIIGFTEMFIESAEPSFDDLPEDEFLALFPPGAHFLIAETVEGDWLFGVAELTHNRPEQPKITSPAEDAEVDPDEPLVVEWETVADPDAPGSVITSYVVVVEKDEDDEPLRVWTVDMLATDNSVTVPPGFLEPGKDYKVEILAVESSNNKTITEIEFETED